MKKQKKRPNLTIYQPAYPNAAEPGYFAERALNAITALVSGLGFISAMVFLVTLA